MDANLARPGVRIDRRNAVAIITLDRPKALNALDGAMREAIASALPVLARDPLIYAIVFKSASERAFCAGGDVRKIIEVYRSDKDAGRELFADEYRLNWALECFSCPSISLMDGIVMGSGAGLTAFNTHRVAGENYRFGMPETAIGLFPDVGVAHVMAHLPSEIGLYLGLTGRVIGRADAFALGLVTHCIPASEFSKIEERLGEAWPVDQELDALHVDPGPGELMGRAETISACFGGGTVPEIMDRLAGVTGAQAQWAAAVADDLAQRSPLSLAVSLRHIREARGSTIEATLIRDYRLACRFLEGHDFAEGVRAMLVDKDKSPKWQPATLQDVDPALVETYFSQPLCRDLDLATREQIQAASRS